MLFLDKSQVGCQASKETMMEEGGATRIPCLSRGPRSSRLSLSVAGWVSRSGRRCLLCVHAVAGSATARDRFGPLSVRPGDQLKPWRGVPQICQPPAKRYHRKHRAESTRNAIVFAANGCRDKCRHILSAEYCLLISMSAAIREAPKPSWDTGRPSEAMRR